MLKLILRCIPRFEAKATDRYYKLVHEDNYPEFFAQILEHAHTQVKNRSHLTLSEDLKDLLQKMICPDATDRWTIEQIKGHPWIQEYFDMNKYRKHLIDSLCQALLS